MHLAFVFNQKLLRAKVLTIHPAISSLTTLIHVPLFTTLHCRKNIHVSQLFNEIRLFVTIGHFATSLYINLLPDWHSLESEQLFPTEGQASFIGSQLHSVRFETKTVLVLL